MRSIAVCLTAFFGLCCCGQEELRFGEGDGTVLFREDSVRDNAVSAKEISPPETGFSHPPPSPVGRALWPFPRRFSWNGTWPNPPPEWNGTWPSPPPFEWNVSWPSPPPFDWNVTWPSPPPFEWSVTWPSPPPEWNGTWPSPPPFEWNVTWPPPPPFYWNGTVSPFFPDGSFSWPSPPPFDDKETKLEDDQHVLTPPGLLHIETHAEKTKNAPPLLSNRRLLPNQNEGATEESASETQQEPTQTYVQAQSAENRDLFGISIGFGPGPRPGYGYGRRFGGYGPGGGYGYGYRPGYGGGYGYGRGWGGGYGRRFDDDRRLQEKETGLSGAQ
uniref:Uncharacterized protein n=1 Tax=Chromera velia CCMP2878 TaxID=1169474 RepID=A0A0G4GEB2_9ALVE|eukprot:Cvel_21513.t1-p1 / transcript=Cvel_21513.t1 / gene=Cvel_21513 / organism=Chromera_velia_CCMP2878 / gene_product=Protein diaphanous homolog 1, putative / transcript_product=Protein diaphanous homolog 1, putative / location=Cvel_scaffold2025:7779-8762(-) / protein_length=328 / sequence_SO=supercontig / SO=protein_coding / is_pseudo=false